MMRLLLEQERLPAHLLSPYFGIFLDVYNDRPVITNWGGAPMTQGPLGLEPDPACLRQLPTITSDQEVAILALAAVGHVHPHMPTFL